MPGSDQFQYLLYPLFHISECISQIKRTKSDIVKNCRHKQLIVRVLKYHANRSSDVGQGAFGKRGVADVNSAPGWLKAAVEMLQQSRFAGAVGSYDADRLAVSDDEGNVFEGNSAIGIDVPQVLPRQYGGSWKQPRNERPQKL